MSPLALGIAESGDGKARRGESAALYLLSSVRMTPPGRGRARVGRGGGQPDLGGGESATKAQSLEEMVLTNHNVQCDEMLKMRANAS